jgi:hypothetical protein
LEKTQTLAANWEAEVATARAETRELRSSLTIFSSVFISASSSASASACSTHSTSQSNACSIDEPTVMMPFGPGIFIFR